MFSEIEGITSFSVLAVGILIFLQAKSANQRITFLEARNQRLANEVIHLKRALHALRKERVVHTTKKEPETSFPDQSAWAWKVSWAKEVLHLQDVDISIDSLKSARRDAVKTRHPDTGSALQRFNDIEIAVDILKQAYKLY